MSKLPWNHQVFGQGARYGSQQWLGNEFHQVPFISGQTIVSKDELRHMRKIITNQPAIRLADSLRCAPAELLVRPLQE